ncbi:MAG: putative porin [Bacteroidota bacterium]|nr:putative porin [Bacteroidota bacterium]
MAVAVVAHGQVIDTTRKINTWMLEHNFTRFEDVLLDTNMHQVQREFNPAFLEGFAYESYGLLAGGVNHVDFMRRPEPSEFLFGRAWNPYMKTAERTIFFNTKTPFTSLVYSTIPVKDWKEESIEMMHTQNFSPYTNFGVEFNILSGKPLYTNQDTRAVRAGLFGSHAKNRYSIFGTFYYNDFDQNENAGIAHRDSFLMGTEEQWWEYEVNLSNAQSHYRNMALFATQKYNLTERKFSTDSLGNTTSTGKTLSISYQLMLERQFKYYSDEVSLDDLSPVYSNYYYLTETALDSATEDKISNVLQLILGDPDYDKISARILAGDELRRFGMLSPETVPVDSITRDTIIGTFRSETINDVFLGFHLAGPTTGVWDWVIDGNYYLLGYKQNDFNLHANFSRKLGGTTDLGLRGSFEMARPHYFTNHYSSSFLRWENDFASMLRIKGEAFIQSDEQEIDIRLGASYISNYIYWDTLAMPQVYDKDLLVLSAHLSKHFKLGGWNSDNRLLVQYSSEKKVLNLPIAVLYSSNYWKQSLFKGALVADLGFDLYYTTKYRASSYMPATGIFHLQDNTDLGTYPFVDVFIAFQIRTTRIFASYNNVLQSVGFAGNDFFTANPYPMKPRHFRLGVTWYFYD